MKDSIRFVSLFLFTFFLACLSLTGIALADDSTSLDFGPLKASVIELVVAIVAALGVYLGAWIRKMIGDTLYNSLLHAGLQRGVDYVTNEIRTRGGSLDISRVDVKNKIVADVGNYMIVNSPKALKWFDLNGDDYDDMADLIIGKLPKPGA